MRSARRANHYCLSCVVLVGQSKRQNVLILHLSGKATQKSELISHPLGSGKESKASQSPTHAPCFPGVGVYSDGCIRWRWTLEAPSRFGGIRFDLMGWRCHRFFLLESRGPKFVSFLCILGPCLGKVCVAFGDFSKGHGRILFLNWFF